MLTDWQARALAALLGVVVALGVGLGLYAMGYRDGYRDGGERVQAKWAKANAAAEKDAARVRKDGYALALKLQDALRELEARYERTNDDLRAALGRPVACPASGKVGDVVLPTELVRSMFNRDANPDHAGAPTAQPDGAVR